MAKGEAVRIILWMCWVTQWLISSIYVALALITFAKLMQASSEIFVSEGDMLKNKIWRAPLAACLLSALLVVGFDLLSCVMLIKKSINRAGPGFGYGFIVAFCFCLSFFLLLCGLVLDGFKNVVKEVLEKPNVTVWTKYCTDTYMGALVFALLGFCTFFLFGIALVILQAGVSAQLGMGSAKYSALAAPGFAAAPFAQGGSSDQQYYGSDGTAQYNDHTGGDGYENESYTQPESQGLFNSNNNNNAATAAGGYYETSDFQATPSYGASGSAAPAPGYNSQLYGTTQAAAKQQQDDGSYGVTEPSAFGHASYNYGVTAAPVQPQASMPRGAVANNGNAFQQSLYQHPQNF